VTSPIGTQCAVTCQVCAVKVWQGDIPPSDGQVLLTAYAESKQGTACPSGRVDCPNKTAAIAAQVLLKPVTMADFTSVKGRLDKLEKGK
jgi:hypothetical protein